MEVLTLPSPDHGVNQNICRKAAKAPRTMTAHGSLGNQKSAVLSEHDVDVEVMSSFELD